MPGFPDGVPGIEFAERLRRQAERFGVEFLQAQDVTGLHCKDNYHVVRTATGDDYSTTSLLIATGSSYRRLNVPGENNYIGAGVHFCATCDGPFYKGKHVAVVGGGNSAAEESLLLTKFADWVTILVRGDHFKASKVIQLGGVLLSPAMILSTMATGQRALRIAIPACWKPASPASSQRGRAQRQHKTGGQRHRRRCNRGAVGARAFARSVKTMNDE